MRPKGIVDDVVGEYGYLIVDECHHISATSFEMVARRCRARYVTGLSATVVRKEGDHPIIFMSCGPLRYRVDDRKQAEFRPFDHKVIVRKTDFRLPNHLCGLMYPALQSFVLSRWPGFDTFEGHSPAFQKKSGPTRYSCVCASWFHHHQVWNWGRGERLTIKDVY